VKENRTTPDVVILAGRPIFEGIAFVGVSAVPAKSASLEDWMQGVDKDKAARQVEPCDAAALAEAADQVVFG
jgi:hypothetical protein